MKYVSVSLLARCSLVIITLGFIAGCGGSQPSIGVPGAMPQAPAIPPARTMLHHIGIASSSYDVLHSFGKRHDGGTPYASLLDVNGTLYGTTYQGGEYGDGTVFSVTTTGTEHVLHSFGSGQDGSGPYASLLDVNGTLYGTTVAGGKYTFGTVFSITTTGTEHVLHSFGGGYDGNGPDASLLSVNGTLFGTTSRGGRYGLGTVFSITVAGVERRLHNFRFRSDGAYPAANLIDVNGTLYGTTVWGRHVQRRNGLQHHDGRRGARAAQLQRRLVRRLRWPSPRDGRDRREGHALRHYSRGRHAQRRNGLQHHDGRRGARAIQLQGRPLRWRNPPRGLDRCERHALRHYS